MRVEVNDIGIMGTGSNFFRCGVVHSSGAVYIGTYGPQPALVWKYDPASGRLARIGAPGEYQIDCMVEAPNGLIYMGTAYSGLVYRLDPSTDAITTVGTPDIDSTSWIFTMQNAPDGYVYGAKGVGLFRLDWAHDVLEPLGIVPGDHRTPGPNASSPITRQLQVARDGTLWGDTNRWLFRYHPATGSIEPLADAVEADPASYALMLPQEPAPTDDCYFVLYARYSGEDVGAPLAVYESAKRRIVPLHLEGWRGVAVGHPAWWDDDGAQRLLIPTWEEALQRAYITVTDPFARRVVGRWVSDQNLAGLARLPGGGLYFIGQPRGVLLHADPQAGQLVTVAENPVPVECRCLAVALNRRLGTDSYDCGSAFTRDLTSCTITDHGKVWRDDHRCNYGPASFAGPDGRYLLANHSEGMPALWVTDTRDNLHWRVGESAAQLVAMDDGSVWGTAGPNPSCYAFDPERCWRPGWASQEGTLFHYAPGDRVVSGVAGHNRAGIVARAPGGVSSALVTRDDVAYVIETDSLVDRAVLRLPDRCVAAFSAPGSDVTYLLLGDESLWEVRDNGDASGYVVARCALRFGRAEDGFFVLPVSGRVVALSGGTETSIYDPVTRQVERCTGAVRPPAGPAVDPTKDTWYLADQTVTAYRLSVE